MRMQATRAVWAEKGELAALFFLQAMAVGMWVVPLTRILEAHGMASLRPYAYTCSAIAAFISPLIFGAMADRHASPVQVLRWLAAASALSLALVTWSIGRHWPAGVFLALMQVFCIFAAPTGSIANTVVFSRLADSQRQFGPIRAAATFGWMVGCWLVSALHADATTLAGYAGAAIWAGLAAFTYLLPSVPPAPTQGHLTIRQRLGWDALSLLRHHDHQVVFITAALFSIPIAAFYPFAPAHLRQIGFERTSAWMTLGQVTEIVSMFALASLFARWRLKWIFCSGLACGVFRFALSALDTPGWLLLGVSLHGFSFALFFITAQIYLNERVPAEWRARAQGLMWLMNAGIGNGLGYLGSGFWFAACTHAGVTRWPMYWSGLSAAAALVLGYFLFAYHGQKAKGMRHTIP
jgi:nucleoside transporter